ncbi:MAG TPA: hypothetical protein VLM75_01240 [Spirochaetota bacterium]|nr:hypothetical protein [Spirochaetota bacterium]
MKNRINLSLILATALLLSLFPGESPPVTGAEGIATVDSAAHQVRRRAEVLYRRWDDGLFGSRRFYRRELQAHLADGIGRSFATGYDYPLIFPEVLTERRFRCRFRYGSWLEISGEIGTADLGTLSGGDLPKPSQWWRGPVLVSLEGKLRRFRLDDGPPRAVVVVLEDMRPVLSKGPAPTTGEMRDR